MCSVKGYFNQTASNGRHCIEAEFQVEFQGYIELAPFSLRFCPFYTFSMRLNKASLSSHTLIL